jgi:hypothetical protein
MTKRRIQVLSFPDFTDISNLVNKSLSPKSCVCVCWGGGGGLVGGL